MRITDNRYRGEIDKFNLAVRLIHHEARTGTIRRFTGFTEDRIRKLYGAYFKSAAGERVRRRRGKSPRQIARFVNSTQRHTEATLLACLCRLCKAFGLTDRQRASRIEALGYGSLRGVDFVCISFIHDNSTNLRGLSRLRVLGMSSGVFDDEIEHYSF